ncbi:MAG TPA: hypothetical protein DEP57_06970 [Selenomonas sp.]|nr:hypothetical protein [Selenomonas sp.]
MYLNLFDISIMVAPNILERISMMMRSLGLIKVFPLILGLLIYTSSACYAVSGMNFVDAEGQTGYYVDLNSVEYGDNYINANIAVVKGSSNRMYLYCMHFDLGKSTYQIAYSKVFAYDTKELLEYNEGSPIEHYYGPSSMMQQIVEYILYPERR